MQSCKFCASVSSGLKKKASIVVLGIILYRLSAVVMAFLYCSSASSFVLDRIMATPALNCLD